MNRYADKLDETLAGGDLVAVGSVSGMRGNRGQAGYNATKAVVMSLVQSLALDHGARVMRLNAVAPASTRTEATAGVGGDEASPAPFVNRIALGRSGEPQDVAPAVLFLAGADAGCITGATLTVDGGTSATTGQANVEGWGRRPPRSAAAAAPAAAAPTGRCGGGGRAARARAPAEGDRG